MNTKEKITINGVTVGEKWIDRNKYDCELIDIQEIKSLITNKIISYKFIGERIVMGQKVKFETCQASIKRAQWRNQG